MFCIICAKSTRVVNSRFSKKSGAVWRRRQCSDCGNRFTTGEKPELYYSQVKVVDRAGKPEPFLEDKLFLSIYASFSHQPANLRLIRRLTNTVVSEILPARQVASARIGKLTYRVLRRVDRVAAVYYKAHHKDSSNL